MAKSERIQEKRDAKRRKIVEAASYRFNREGFHGTSISKLSRKVGLTTTGLYHYVDNKETLLYYCYLATVGEMERIIHRAEQLETDPADRFFSIIFDYFSVWSEIASGDHPTLALLNDIDALTPKHKEALLKRFQTALMATARMYEDGIESERFKQIDSAQAALLLISIIAWLPIVIGLRPDFDQLGGSFRATLHLLKHGISKKPTLDWDVLDQSASRILSELTGRIDLDGTQDKIYRRATQAFNTFGFTATKLDLIAMSNGLTKGAIYHYIDSKEELLLRCIERSSAIKRFIFDSAKRNAPSGLFAVILAAVTIGRLQTQDIGPLASSRLIAQLKPWHAEGALAIWNEDRDLLESLVTAGVDDGTIDPDAQLAVSEAITAVLDYIPISSSLIGEESATAALATFWSVFESGLCQDD